MPGQHQHDLGIHHLHHSPHNPLPERPARAVIELDRDQLLPTVAKTPIPIPTCPPIRTAVSPNPSRRHRPPPPPPCPRRALHPVSKRSHHVPQARLQVANKHSQIADQHAQAPDYAHPSGPGLDDEIQVGPLAELTLRVADALEHVADAPDAKDRVVEGQQLMARCDEDVQVGHGCVQVYVDGGFGGEGTGLRGGVVGVVEDGGA
ncbi:hypothetical protein SCAR479_12014 [Seiridium cardinale]|uniref:Uncharacterized protein n=1 Tax=Seiridium cardinale TaxID=138064 RepID=A0ABR2XCF0_9PEZI